MIVDTSAIVAILRDEPEGVLFQQILNDADTLRISAASYVELSIVLDNRTVSSVVLEIDRFLERFNIVIEPLTARQALIAREAYRYFGKGSGHRAGLNFGDCFSYALARDKREPLLFKGDDFGFTDLRSAGEGR